MVRTIQGLPFQIEGPAFYRLDPRLTRQHIIDICYLGADELPGDAAPASGWCLFFSCPNGEVLTRFFDSRDDAIGMVAQAFRTN